MFLSSSRSLDIEAPSDAPCEAGGEQGFALVEVLVAAVLLLVGLAGILDLVDAAASTTTTTRTREAATTLQRELVEGARSVPYGLMEPGTLAGLVSRRPGLSDSSLTPGWTISRRKAVFTVSVGVCTVDDPRDGIGAHQAGTFCRPGRAASAAECARLMNDSASQAAPARALAGDCGLDIDLDGSVDGLVDETSTACDFGACGSPVDPNPADYKRVVSLVRWAGGRWNLQTTTVNQSGAAAAPAVTSFSAATEKVTTGTGLVLNATVDPTPAVVSITLDGRQVTTASPATAGAWTATWYLGPVSDADGGQPAGAEVLDGHHLLSAAGLDRYGQFGAKRSVAVLVNRRRPFAPALVSAGRNGGVVEIEWSPPKESDLEGHRVYRLTSTGGRVLVCELARSTGCQEANPPASGDLSYDVVGVDRDPSGALREGDRSAAAVATSTNRPPPPPQSLGATLEAGGVVLRWSAPATPDPDPGDAIDHYNVYRDGTSRTNRIDRTEAAEPSWTDTTANGVQHTYWVTAVDRHLAESPVLGPVSR